MSEEDQMKKEWQKTPMSRPRIRKVTVNISVGQSGEPLERAGKVLQELTDQKPVKRKAKQTIRDFNIRKGEPIACKVTLRKDKAIDFLKKALEAVDNKIPRSCFDDRGNFSFGIKEHIEIPGTKYRPELGIFGMDVSVVIDRSGTRVKERRWAKSKLGRDHLLTPEESIVFVKDTIGVEVV
jgi:large subunit ribosomal protein L5